MITALRFSSIQKGLLLFWAAWLSLVALTDVLGGSKALGALPQGWTLASYNHGMVVATVGAHGVPAGVAAVLTRAVPRARPRPRDLRRGAVMRAIPGEGT